MKDHCNLDPTTSKDQIIHMTVARAAEFGNRFTMDIQTALEAADKPKNYKSYSAINPNIRNRNLWMHMANGYVDSKDASEEEQDANYNGEMKIRAYVSRHLDTSLAQTFLSYASAHDGWVALLNELNLNYASTAAIQEQQFKHLQQEPNQNLYDWAATIKSLHQKLVANGITKTPQELADKFCNYLTLQNAYGPGCFKDKLMEEGIADDFNKITEYIHDQVAKIQAHHVRRNNGGTLTIAEAANGVGFNAAFANSVNSTLSSKIETLEATVQNLLLKTTSLESAIKALKSTKTSTPPSSTSQITSCNFCKRDYCGYIAYNKECPKCSTCGFYGHNSSKCNEAVKEKARKRQTTENANSVVLNKDPLQFYSPDCNSPHIQTTHLKLVPEPPPLDVAHVLLDSACSSSITRTSNSLQNIQCKPPKHYSTANGGNMQGSGNFGELTHVSSVDPNFSFKNVEHVPGTTEDLISVSSVLDDGYDIVFDSKTMTAKICKLQRSDEDAIIGVASLHLEFARMVSFIFPRNMHD